MKKLLIALALVGLVATPVSAQSTTGAIVGVVTDPDGAALPGVQVNAANPATGFSRTVTTGADGSFRLAALPAGTYNVTAQISGFSTFTQESVVVNVASERSLEIGLKLASVEETITVVDEAPLLATTPSIGTVVSQTELETLPLNGRQFANLAVLAPGTTLGYNSDPTKPDQLIVALNGGIGRNVNYVMDGGDNTDDTIGGALQNFSLESVQEFKIQTMQYKAEYGRSSGGVLTVVTKSGTNELEGSAYGYFRDDGLNTKTETETRAGVDKQPYERTQFGASLGGPIVRDKAHFFATYEKTDRETSYTVNTGGAFPTFDGISVAQPFTDELISAKATLDLNARQLLSVRYGYQKNDGKYGASSLAAPDSLGTLTNEYESILASHTTQIGSDKLNEFVFQYTTFDNVITADSNDASIYYPSGFHTGQNINTPQTTSQVKYQYKDDFSWTSTFGDRRHDFKVGGQFIHEPTLGGDFSTGLTGQYTALNDALGSPITTIQVNGGFFGDDTPVDQYSAYIQDDIYWSDRLTINVGVRYDYWDGFDLDQRSSPLWQALHNQTRYNESYLNDFKSDDGILDNDDNNYAARFGFTYDLKGDGRQLLRGGFGTFYDFPYTNATILFPASAVQSDFGVIYSNFDKDGIRNADGTFFQPGQQLPPNQGGSVGAKDEVASSTLATPYSDQISLGYSWQVNDWLGINIDAVSIDYHDLPFRFRPNTIDPATGNRRFAPEGFTNLFRIWYGGGRASYDGINIGARVRREKFELQGFYTLSESEGNVLAGADEFRLYDTNKQSDLAGGRFRRDVSVDPLNPLCDACFGPLYTDARHKLTFGGLYRAPWDLVLSGMLRYHSAFPYTEHANADLNGDGFNDLRPGVSNVNSGRASSFAQFDVRVSRDFMFGGGWGVEILVEVFNVFNEENPNLVDRFGNASAFSGDPLQGEQRLAQIGARVHF
jgi:hypothetical protein